MADINTLTLCRDKYKTEEEFTAAISTAVKLLLDAEYIMTVRYDEPGLGICCIDYDHANITMGNPYPVWLSTDEWDLILDYRYNKDEGVE